MNDDMLRSARFALTPEVILTELEDGTGVLLHLKTKFYYVLNATGVNVWTRLSQQDEGASVELLADGLIRDYDVDRQTAARDVSAIVRELLDEGLVRLAP